MPYISEEYYQELLNQAQGEIGLEIDEDWNVSDYSGGNIDDAYSMGISHGHVEQARRIVDHIIENDG